METENCLLRVLGLVSGFRRLPSSCAFLLLNTGRTKSLETPLHGTGHQRPVPGARACFLFLEPWSSDLVLKEVDLEMGIIGCQLGYHREGSGRQRRYVPTVFKVGVLSSTQQGAEDTRHTAPEVCTLKRQTPMRRSRAASSHRT